MIPSDLAALSTTSSGCALSSAAKRRRATRERLGTTAFSISRYLGSRFSWPAWKVTPVRFAPGWGRLATAPSRTPTPPARKTMGTVRVAFFTASVRDGDQTTIRSTLSRTNSAAMSSIRSPAYPGTCADPCPCPPLAASSRRDSGGAASGSTLHQRSERCCPRLVADNRTPRISARTR